MAWTAAIHKGVQSADQLAHLGLVESPHNSIIAEFNSGLTRFNKELVVKATVFEIPTSLLLGASERRSEFCDSVTVHGQQHDIIAVHDGARSAGSRQY